MSYGHIVHMISRVKTFIPGISSTAGMVVPLIISSKVNRSPNSFSTVVFDMRMEPVQIETILTPPTNKVKEQLAVT